MIDTYVNFDTVFVTRALRFSVFLINEMTLCDAYLCEIHRN